MAASAFESAEAIKSRAVPLRLDGKHHNGCSSTLRPPRHSTTHAVAQTPGGAASA